MTTFGSKRAVLLLGSTGFIGRNLIRFFERTASPPILRGISSKEIDLTKRISIKQLIAHYDDRTTIILASALTRDKQDDIDSMNQNIAMVQHVAAAIQIQKPAHLIFLSSCDVYGNANQRLPIHEETVCEPNTYYGVSKFIGEFILKKTCEQKQIPLTILRFGGIYGSDAPREHIVFKFINSGINDEPILIYGDGSDTRDYVFIGDLCQTIKKIIDQMDAGVFNIVTGTSYSVLQIAQLVEEFLMQKIKVRFEPRRRELFHCQFDNRKLKKVCGSFTFLDLRKFIQESLNPKLIKTRSANFEKFS